MMDTKETLIEQREEAIRKVQNVEGLKNIGTEEEIICILKRVLHSLKIKGI